MSIWEVIAILVAGVGAGAINAVVGSGTLITFPTLVAFGFPPVTATMTNAVGLVTGGVSGTWGYRRELAGQWPRLRWQIPASLLGAVAGSWLLLHLPEKAFETIVPVLLILALVLVVVAPRLQRWTASNSTRTTGDEHDVALRPRRLVVLTTSTFAVGIYGGYFTAAQGILLMGAMGVIVDDTLQRLNATKNLLSLVVNVVAALTYTLVAFDRINWAAAGLIAIGSLAGGVIGSRYGRNLSPTALRGVIVAVGVVGLWRLLA